MYNMIVLIVFLIVLFDDKHYDGKKVFLFSFLLITIDWNELQLIN